MKIHVEVTQGDIEAAENHAGEYDKCPIARALIRQDFSDLQVDENHILATKDEKSWKYATPKKIQLFIDDFDNHKPVTPISFDLINPELACFDDYYRNRTYSK